MSTHSPVLQYAHTHEQLLRALEEVDSAHERLTHNIAYIADLDAQIAAGAKTVKKARHAAVVESIGYERYRDSNVRKYAYKMTGRGQKWNKDKSREEQEYLDALQKQKDAEENWELVKQLHIEAKLQTKQLEKEAQRFDALQQELYALYDSVFGEATPELADVSGKLERFHVARRIHDEQEPVIPRELRILKLLRQINAHANIARDRLDEAETASLADLGSGRMSVSYITREKIRITEEEIRKLRLLQDELIAVASDILALPTVNAAAPGHATSEILFDNVYTDISSHSRIKKTSRQLDTAMRQCQDLLRQKEAYFKQLTIDFEQAKSDLDAARAALQQAAQKAFRRVLNGEEGGAASHSAMPVGEEPPPYSA